MSLAAFTDSIVTISSPLATVRPSAGSSTNTRSPSCSVACSVMPTTTSSPSCFSHSCSSVNRSIRLSVASAFVARGDEGQFRHCRRQRTAAQPAARAGCRAPPARSARSPWRQGASRLGPKPPEVIAADRLAVLGRRRARCPRASAPGPRAAGRRAGASAPSAICRRIRRRRESRRRGRRRAAAPAGSPIRAPPRPASSSCRCRGPRGRARPRAAASRGRRARPAARRIGEQRSARSRRGRRPTEISKPSSPV